MKFLILFAISLIGICSNAQIYNQKTWATYYFGASSGGEVQVIDNDGNVIVLGSLTKRLPFPYHENFTTAGAHKSGFSTTSINFDLDCTLSKFTPSGNLVWATQFGGDSLDTCKKMVLDSDNNIYFVGTTSSITGIATLGSFDESLPQGIGSKLFLTKFDTNGVQQWGTYINGSSADIGICMDANENIYVNGKTKAISGISTFGVYQYDYQDYINVENPSAGSYNGFVMKFDTNGNRLAATYLGKTTVNGLSSKIAVDGSGNLIVIQHTNYYSNNQLATPGCYQNMTSTSATYDSGEATITKLNSSLSQVLWSTYYGGINNGGATIFSVACDNNTIFIAGRAQQANNFTTPGCFQPNVLNNSALNGPGFITSFNADGARLWATYNPETVFNMSISNNKLYICGSTNDGNNNLGTLNSYQSIYVGGFGDGYFSEFNTDGTRNWSSYFGGEGYENINSISVKDNNMYVTGFTGSINNISTTGSLQPNFNIGNLTPSTSNINMFLAKFNKDNLTTNDFSNLQLQLSPNPNNGQFTITGNINNLQKNISLLIYDTLGRQIASKEVQITGNQINHEFNFANQLSQGLYFAKISDGISVLQTFKVLVN